MYTCNDGRPKWIAVYLFNFFRRLLLISIHLKVGDDFAERVTHEPGLGDVP